MIRKAAVAGRWYPGTAPALAAAVDGYLAGAATVPGGELLALVAPHAGLVYSGSVAAYAYNLLRDRRPETVVIVGPSHAVGFDGVSVYASGGFETPLGVAGIDEGCAAALMECSRIVRDDPAPHLREHSLEMQLPFVQRVAPEARIVPLLMGYQTADSARALSEALVHVLRTRPDAVMIASTDLSHYHDAATAALLDAVVIDCVSRLDAEALQRALDARPDHACGGGPTVAVMRAARALGATGSLVLQYADSGDVSGDKSAVVGYLAAALGAFDRQPSHDTRAANTRRGSRA